MKKCKLISSLLLFLMINLLAAIPASAAIIYELNLGAVYTGSTPNGDAPWLTAQFEDTGVNTVKLTLISHLQQTDALKGSKGEQGWVFNFSGDATSLNISNFSTNHGYYAESITIANNGVKLSPLGKDFDIGFSWGAKNRFGAGAIESYLITGNGVTAQSFMVANSNGFYSAAHVQSIDPCDASGKIYTKTYTTHSSVPEPATLLLLGPGVVGIVVLRGRRKGLSN